MLAHEIVEEIDQPMNLRRLVQSIQLTDNVHEIRLERALESALEKPLLVLEVPEDERLADPRFLGDLRKRGAAESLRGEQPGSGLEDLVAGIHAAK